MRTISAVVVVKNEEVNIADCLDTLTFCDEIIVVDDGSTDRTYDIAKRYTDKVFKHKSEGFVEAARKFAIQKATKDWVINIDADERVTEALAKEIRTIIEKDDTTINAYKIPRQNFFLGNHPWPPLDPVEKLFRRKEIVKKDWQMHGTPDVAGDIGSTHNVLLHYTHINLEQMLNKTIEWSKAEAMLRLNANHPKMTWWRFPRVMFTGFYEWYIRQRGYKAGTVGIIEGIYQAYSMFITYARLWEIQQGHDSTLKK